MNRVLELAACNLLGKSVLLPISFLVAYFSHSVILALVVIVVGSLAINQILHRTWIYVDPDLYWKYRERFAGLWIISFAVYLALSFTL